MTSRFLCFPAQFEEMEEVLPCFDLGFDCLLPTEPEEKKQKKEAPEHFASLDDRELDDLVEGAQAKSTKYTKYAVSVFQGNFGIKCTTIKLFRRHSLFTNVQENAYQTISYRL